MKSFKKKTYRNDQILQFNNSFWCKKNILRFWGPNLPLCQFGVGHQRVKLKRFHFFPEKFPLFFWCVPVFYWPFSRIIPEKGRKQTGKKAENFPKKERNLLSFQVMTNCCSFSFFYEHTPLRMEHLI